MTPALADITTLLASIQSALTFLWGLFGDAVETIATNPLLLFSVLFAIGSGAIGVVLKVTKKFGLKGRR